MTPWERATLALRLLHTDPSLGGILLHARAGAAREAYEALLPPSTPKIHPMATTAALRGGVDVSASLAEGALVRHAGILDRDDPLLILTMAERTPPDTATTLAEAVETGKTLIAFDEHAEDDPPAPAALRDRLAFHVSLEGSSLRDLTAPQFSQVSEQAVKASDAFLEDIVTLAVSLGIHSLRAPFLALQVAKAHAALNNRSEVIQDDVLIAAELVLAPRATQLPQPPESEAPQEAEQPQDNAQQEQDLTQIPQDILLQAIATALPPNLLDHSVSNISQNSSGSGVGQRQIGNRRGRPLPARNRGAGGQARVDLMATLRAAVPWQTLRRAQGDAHPGPIIRPTDLRYKRYEDHSDRLLIFTVDASGSAAIARLAEAKGAVELLLGEAYARRDHVALIAFRGTEAETLLPPTRSLVQTKRRLADLPGGGGTPLASGLKCGFETAVQACRKGLSPMLILLTDGRGNIALNGEADRTQAARDATQIARHIAHARIDSLVIDTSRRPERDLRRLSMTLQGRYAALPRADAQALSQVVAQTLDS